MAVKSRATKCRPAKKVLAKTKMKKTGGGHNQTDLEFFKPSPTSPTLLKSGSGS